MAQSQVQASGVRLKNVTGGGLVLCTGNYSYIANNPDNLEANNASVIRVGATGTELAARLAKVRNDGGTLCDAASVLDTNKRYATNDVSELISSGSRLLVVRGMTVTPNPAPGTPFYQEFTQGRGIYTVTLTIGTGVGTEFVSNTCRPPSDQLGNLDFCAIDTFAFTTRVGSSNR